MVKEIRMCVLQVGVLRDAYLLWTCLPIKGLIRLPRTVYTCVGPKKNTYMTVDFMEFNICSLTSQSLNAMGANAMGTRERVTRSLPFNICKFHFWKSKCNGYKYRIQA